MKVLLYAIRIAALVIILLVAHVIGAAVSGVSGGDAAAAPAGGAAETTQAAEAAEAIRLLLAVVVVCVLETLVLAYPIVRARWGGWKLTGVVFVLVFGVMSFQAQIEAAFFGVLPLRTTVRIMVMGAVIAAIIAPAAVLLLGRWKPPIENDLGRRMTPGVISVPGNDPGGHFSAGVILLRLGGVAVFYVVLYTVFGHFVAWQSPEVRAFYGGGSGDGGLAELGLFTIPWLGPFQFLRGLIWAGLGLLVIRAMRGRWWEKGLATGLLFAVLMNAQLLLPNEHMPESVRVVHLVETATSNFILGWWIAWLFRSLSRAGG